MNVITLKDLKNLAAWSYGADSLESLTIAELKDFPDDTKIVVLSYCDYGGSLIDKALIRLFRDKYKDNILVKDTYYYGEHAYVYPTSKSTEYSDNVVSGNIISQNPQKEIVFDGVS